MCVCVRAPNLHRNKTLSHKPQLRETRNSAHLEKKMGDRDFFDKPKFIEAYIKGTHSILTSVLSYKRIPDCAVIWACCYTPVSLILIENKGRLG